MKRTKNLIISAVLLWTSMSIGQTDAAEWTKIPDYMGKSPEAAAVVRNGDYNVNMAKGLANIGIPLYTLQAGKFSLPINLNYNSQGIKVAQDATWVGLGWDLSPGAQIILEVKDKPDQETVQTMPDLTQVNTLLSAVPNWSINHPNLNGLKDHSWMKDIYHFSSPTASGKFIIIDEDVDRVKVFPPDAFKVEAIGSAQSRTFKITDPHGNIYNFTTTKELSQTTGVSGAQEYISAWLVDNITTPSNDVITFNYVNDGWHAKRNRNDKVTYANTRKECATGQLSSGTLSGSISSDFTTTTKTYKLNYIDYRNVRLLFATATGRLDLATPSQLAQAQFPNQAIPPVYLNYLYIQKKTGAGTYTTVKGYHFNYSYFDSGGGDAEYWRKRLRLDSVSDLPAEEITSFTYSNVTLPSKHSKSMDVWGYNNGQSNSTLIPAQNIWWYPNLIPVMQTIGGGNRTVNPAALQAGMLTEIKYPTKGKVKFVYEPNQYYGIDEAAKFIPITISSAVVEGTGTPPGHPVEIEGIDGPECAAPNPLNCVNYVYIPYTAHGNVNAIISYDVLYNGSLTINKYEYGRVRVFGGGFTYDSTKLQGNSSVNTGIILHGSGMIQIEAYGSSMKVQNFQLKYTDIDNTLKNVNGPGLRVKEIQSYENDATMVAKKLYTYKLEGSNNSSGKLIFDSPKKFDPEFYYVLSHVGCPEGGMQWQYVQSSIYSGQSTYFSMNEVSYTDVREESIDVVTLANNGYTNYKFNFEPVTASQDGAIYIAYDWKRGQLVRKQVYNNANKILLEEINTYGDDNRRMSTVKGFRLRTRMTYLFTPTATDHPNEPGVPIYENELYNYNIYWYYKSKTETNEYFYNSSNVLTGTLNKVTNYIYDNPAHLQLSRVETTDSNNITISSKTLYADDLIAEPQMAALKTANRIAEPISSESYKNGVKLSAQKKVYEQSAATGNLLLPRSIYSAKFPNTLPSIPNIGNLEKNVTYNYDDSGNVIQYQMENGTPVSIIWGYFKTQPVAKLENVAYSAIVPTSLISTIQSNTDAGNDPTSAFTALRSAAFVTTPITQPLITTYAFKPLIGVSKITDPKNDVISYEYDLSGRLVSIKDKQGNILTENKYNYRP